MLNNLNEQTIITTIIEHSNNAVQAQDTNIILFDDPHPNRTNLYQQDLNQIHGISHQHIDISASEIAQIDKINSISYQIHNELYPNYLNIIIQPTIETIAVVPIVLLGRLKALLIFSFEKKPTKNEHNIRLKELGDRFAIALEKSAWNEELYQQAHYDSLTRLPNRLLLIDRLQQALNTSRQNQTVFSLLYLDLDEFKSINDSFGHAAGDSVLKMVANKLVGLLSDGITISRMGGDEFLILLPNQANQEILNDEVSKLAQQLLAALSEPFEVENQQSHLSTSIGIANFPSDGDSVDSLMANADTAMYHAKEKGKNNFQFYSSDLTEKALQKLVLKTDLFNAFQNNEFQVYYQAKVCARTQSIVGAEGLLRWLHPTKGFISPVLFIPLAEETGLIEQLGEWVINQCCLDNKYWQNQGLAPIKVSANLSPKQFQQINLVSVIENALFHSGLESKYLDLEIVEGTAMTNTEQTIAILNQLKQLNIHVSIDDYGTGFSSLGYIKKFPVDTLKIDKSFIDNITHNKGDQAIVNSTIILAHNLGLTVVAEGVENIDQFSILQEYNCDEIQGYYFSKPIPAGDFEQFMQQPPKNILLNRNEGQNKKLVHH
ncbi:UNVERIFIED_CONTAM: hypothetical protein GTU68_051724 [Idotea baltica]|nr:hypothetical protein [Idotea baltica]